MEGTDRSVWRCWFRVHLINFTVPETSRTYRYQFQLDWCHEPKLIKDPALEESSHIISPSTRCQMSAPSLGARRNMWPHSIHRAHLSCPPGISSVPLAVISDTAGRAHEFHCHCWLQLRDTPLSLWASPCPSLLSPKTPAASSILQHSQEVEISCTSQILTLLHCSLTFTPFK